MIQKVQLTRETLYEGLTELSKHIDCDNLVVIGTGAVAQLVNNIDDIAAKFSVTEDIDICLSREKYHPEKGADYFDKGSAFHIDNGFYIQLLDDTFYSNLESKWKDRATQFTSENGKIFHILSPIDLASNKILVSRHKDFDTVSSMIKDQFIDREYLRALQNILASEQPKLATHISLVNEALDIRIDRSQKGFAERLAKFADNNRPQAKTFDIILGILGIPLPLDGSTPPAIDAAERHFDDKRIDGKTLIQRLTRFAPLTTKQALGTEIQ